LEQALVMRVITRSPNSHSSHQKRSRIVAGVASLSALVLVIVASVVVGSSASSADAKHGHEGLSIHIITTLVPPAAVNAAGNGGPGDVVDTVVTFTAPDGQAGHADVSCTNFSNGEQLCHAAFVFTDGQIDAQVAVAPTTTTFAAAIIGGTGAYEGASGQIVNVRTAPGVVDRTFHVLRGED
jgi:hypothetical protein